MKYHMIVGIYMFNTEVSQLIIIGTNTIGSTTVPWNNLIRTNFTLK